MVGGLPGELTVTFTESLLLGGSQSFPCLPRRRRSESSPVDDDLRALEHSRNKRHLQFGLLDPTLPIRQRPSADEDS